MRRHSWILGAATVALLAGALPAMASPDDDCGCDPPSVPLAQASPSAAPRRPATLTLDHEGAVLRLEADAIEGLLDGGPVEARGDVIATFRDWTLQAESLTFDRETGKGVASGSVRLARPTYRLVAEKLTFDAQAETAQAHHWRAWIDGEVQASGRLLSLDAERSVGRDVALSPCLAEDPGYGFDLAELEWTPRPGGSRISGRNAVVRVGGVPVFWLPYFKADLPFPKLPQRFESPEIRSHVQAGYDAFDGFYATSSGAYELAPGWSGRVPVRATTQRGVTVGVEQRLPLPIAEGRLDAFYTSPFPGNTRDFLPGPRANLSLFRDLPGGVGIMSVGYRVDVGNPFRIGPYPSLSNIPVSRLPELSYHGMSHETGIVRWSPSARLGYLIEEGGAASPLAELALSGSGPEAMLPGRIRLGTFGSLRGSAYRELTAAERASGDAFLGRMARGVAQAGLSASTDWLGFRLGGVAEAVRVLSSTPANSLGTPFGHDGIAPQDRLSGSARRHLFGPLSAGIDATLARPIAALGPSSWVPSDMNLTLSYEVNCLSIRFEYKPLIKGWGFSYLVTTF